MMLWAFALAHGADTPLGNAVRARELTEVRALLADGADVDATQWVSSSYGTSMFPIGSVSAVQLTPLQLSLPDALDGDTRVLDALLAAGADVEAHEKDARSAVHATVRNLSRRRSSVVFERLVAHGGVLVDAQQTALGWAGQGDRLPLLERLVELDVPVDRLVCDALTVDELRLLADAGAALDAPCDTRPPLHRATRQRDLARVRFLLEQGVPPDSPGMEVRSPVTAVHLAARLKWVKGLEVLLDGGASVDATVGMLGGPPLRMALGPSAAVLARRGAVRTRAHADPAVWTARPLSPREVAPYLVSMVTHVDVPVLEGFEPVANQRAEVLKRLEKMGASRFVGASSVVTAQEVVQALEYRPDRECSLGVAPRFSDAKDVLGPVQSRERSRGGIRTWHFADGLSAKGWRTLWRSQVVEVHGGCANGTEQLRGLPRSAVWLALGPPSKHLGSDDVWDSTDVRVGYDEDGRAERFGRFYD